MRNIAACAVVGTAMTGLLRTPAVNSAEADGLVVYNKNSLGTGTRENPVPVWRGWAGPNKYYLFAAEHLETASPVRSIQELNRDNVAIYGRNLSGPYIGMLRGHAATVHGFQIGILPNPNAPQEQKPSIPMMALPKVNSEKGWSLSQTDKNAIVLASELIVFGGVLIAARKLKNIGH